jgi:CheY-like chemotaxis protein
VKLVISDVMLPGIGGESVVEHAKRTLPGVPTLLISGYVDGKRETATPADAILWKPFPLATLARRATDAVRPKASATSTSTS